MGTEYPARSVNSVEHGVPNHFDYRSPKPTEALCSLSYLSLYWLHVEKDRKGDEALMFDADEELDAKLAGSGLG